MISYFLDYNKFEGSEDDLLAIENFIYKQWYQNGLLHRIDGPAVISPTGYKEWWIDQKPVSETEIAKKINEQSMIYSFKEHVTKSLNLNESEDLYQQIDKISKKLKEQKRLESIFKK